LEPSIDDGTNSTPIVQGCTAFLVVYYLDNLACDAAVRSLDVPRSKFFTKDVIDSISKADKVGLTYGKLPLREESLTVYKDIRSSAAVQVSAARDSVELVFTARGGPVTQTTNAPPARRGPTAKRVANTSRCAPDPSGVPQIQPFIADLIASSSISDDAMKATVSNAIKAYDRTVKSHIRKIQAQQTVIDEAQNEIRNCQASIQTAQKGLVHQISAIVERRKDAGERYLGAHPVLSVPSVVQSITMIHNLRPATEVREETCGQGKTPITLPSTVPTNLL